MPERLRFRGMSTRIIDRLTDVARPTGEDESLAITYPDSRPRLHLSPKLALIAATVVALIVGVIVARILFVSGDSDAAAPPFPTLTDASPPGEGTGEAIVVSVVGAVQEPGLVTLATGDRIADAITAAGGLVAGADPAAINQAQLLVDGQQIVIPAAGEPSPGPGPGPAAAGHAGDGSGKVSLNSADSTQLVTLDGVGDATAAAIIAHREEIGGFTALEQLLDVSGIGPAKFESMRDQVTL